MTADPWHPCCSICTAAGIAPPATHNSAIRQLASTEFMGLSLRLLTLVLLLALVAFFAASEFALMRLRPTRVQELAERGNAAALAIARLQRHLRRALLATQLGLSLALLALGWGSHSLLTLLHGSTPPAWLQLVVFGLLALLATLLGGLLPKAWVLDDPENAALRLGPLLESVNQALAPLLSAIEALANVLLRASGPAAAMGPAGAIALRRRARKLDRERCRDRPGARRAQHS